MKLASLTAGFLAAAALLGAGAAQAGIDVHWVVTGEFADGGALNGFFDIDQYGFITDWDLTTSGATSLEYKRLGESGSNTATTISVGPDYQDYLFLTFAAPLTALNADNALVTGSASFECYASFSCPSTSKAAINRFLTSGSAVGTRTSIGGDTGGGGGNGGPVPEPATWALMIAGFGLAGAGLRRRRAVAA